MSNDIQFGDDIIDSRDVIARIDDLESDIEDFEEEIEQIDEALQSIDDGVYDKGAEPDRTMLEHEREQAELQLEEAQDELAIWREFEDAEPTDWLYGEAFIRDEHFPDYARQLAEDIVADLRTAEWPFNCIDWTKAAEELQQDYTEVDVKSEIYWVRA